MALAGIIGGGAGLLAGSQLGPDYDVDATKPQDMMSERQEEYRGGLRDVFEERMTRTGPTALEEAMRQRAMEQQERQRRRSGDELSRALEQRGIQDSGVAATGQQQLARQLSEGQAEVDRNLMQQSAQRRQQYSGLASQLSGQDLQAASQAAQAQTQADMAAEQADQQQWQTMMRGLGTMMGGWAQGGFQT